MAELLLSLKFINVLIASILALFAWDILEKTSSKLLFTCMVAGYSISTILFFPEGEINEWLRHSPFYIAQILFYYYFKSVFSQLKNESRGEAQPTPVVRSTTNALFVATHTTSNKSGLLNMASGYGFQHLVTLPLVAVVTIAVALNIPKPVDSNLARMYRNLLIAAWSLTMIHVGEYLVETQDLFPALGGSTIELIEILWFYIGSIMIWFSLRNYLNFKESKAKIL